MPQAIDRDSTAVRLPGPLCDTAAGLVTDDDLDNTDQ
jgi:hypothetical protein